MGHSSLAYVSTPYTKWPDGLDAAFEVASALTGRLLASGLLAYSPIAHSHPLARHAKLDPLDLTIWYPHNVVMMERCDVLIVVTLTGWEQSAGVKYEIEFFQGARKPIYLCDPQTLTMKKWETRERVDTAELPL